MDLRYPRNLTKDVIYEVFGYGTYERNIRKARNINTRWGASRSTHFTIVLNAINDSNFLFCNLLLVDLNYFSNI